MAVLITKKHQFLISKKLCSGLSVPNTIWLAYMSKWSSNLIRSSFLSYFEERSHKFIPSCPVISWNDPSLDFVNAGMNQFKSVFLGKTAAPVKAAANYQKCIRVGGKHNDLSDVGFDTYHHTFFEMLGNWSFQSYSKKEACQMSWELLTKVFNINPEHLYVTYFGGDEKFRLEADLEVQEIWKSIGVPIQKILPFGPKENFWEMGQNGPCGPCTEIHYEKYPSSQGYLKVNRGSKDLIELWNLVFIQYQRTGSGEIIPLDKFYIDTGMGLERLTAILNGKTSNYDTDLFLPLFDTIKELSSKPKYEGKVGLVCLDTHYRILADHSRMITSALADGLLPQDSENLRRVIRRSLQIGSEIFGLDYKGNWLGILSEQVVDILGQTYPELIQNLQNVKYLLEFEAEMWAELNSQINKEWQDIAKQNPLLSSLTYRTPQLIEALKYILPKVSNWKQNGNSFPLDEALLINRNYCLQPYVVEEVIRLLNFNFNFKTFNVCSRDNDLCNKVLQNLDDPSENTYKFLSKIALTNDSFKYDYKFNHNGAVECHLHTTTICAIVDKSGQEVLQVCKNDDKSREQIGIVLKSTNFYSQAGGQNFDIGTMQIGENIFKVNKVINLKGYIVHYGEVSTGIFKTGDRVELHINKGMRTAISKHHTAQHLLVAAVKSVTGMAFQRESRVSNKEFTVDLFKHPSLKLHQIINAEKIVQSWISQRKTVSREQKFIYDALKEDACLSSGEKYPDNVFVISTDCVPPTDISELWKAPKDRVRSSELCCGTHIYNTSHLGSFAITDIKMRSRGLTCISGVCGKEATKLNETVPPVKCQLEAWGHRINEAIKTDARLREMSGEFKTWKQTIRKSSLPATFYFHLISECDRLTELMNKILNSDSNWTELLEEFREVVSKNPNDPIIYKMKTEYRGSLANLETIILEAKDRPAAFVCAGWGRVRACVFIPNVASNRIPAEQLLEVMKEKEGGGSFRITSYPGGKIGTFILNGVKAEKRSCTESNLLKLCQNFINI